VEEGVTPY